MEITEKNRERSTIITAVCALVVIGVSLLASTWQTMRHQREAEEQHLFLTSRAVLLAVENSLRRGPVRVESSLTPRTAELFQGLEQDGDVLFAGLIDAEGGKLLTAPLHGDTPVQLPPEALRVLFGTGEWHGRITTAGRGAYAYGKKLAPVRGRHMGMHHEPPGPPVFLVVGIDMEKHLGVYKGFRQNAVFQAGYILVAALFTWALALNFLSRRDQARKAVSLERFQSRLLDNLPDGLITLDAGQVITSANPAALTILGRSPGSLAGRPVGELPSGVAECIREQSRDGVAVSWQRVTVEGAHLEILTLPVTNDDAPTFLVIIRDRTRLRRLEQSLAEAEKLAAIGTLAAGVAHEVRNPLSSLRGFAQYFVKKLSGRQPEEEYARTMVREADRLNRVITGLLFLSRPRTVAAEDVHLETVVVELEQLLRFDLERKRVRLETDLGVGVVHADADALKQTLLNLLLNSLDALPEGGEPLVIASGKEEGAVWIDVRDRGEGMSAEQREHAFEAFFTAKEHGTGLGLALVRRAMQDHGGSASIISEPGQGTAVRLVFPADAIASSGVTE